MTARTSAAHPARSRLDKDAIKNGLLQICAFYCGGPGRAAGRRTVFACGGCRKTKLEVLADKGIAGCFNASCPVPTTTDALGLIAHFENIDAGRNFRAVLVRGYEILGLDDSTDRPRRHQPPTVRPADPPKDPNLPHDVFSRLLRLCQLSERDLAYWASRGVTRETTRAGRFGSTTANGTRRAIRDLEAAFGAERLTSVPGFFRNSRGGISFTLTGDYTLIPYHDPSGRVTTIEGRSVTEAQLRRTSKYVSLRNSGSHLYVFPGMRVDDIDAITEGVMGPIVAAQNNLRVASIKGIRCYRGPGGGPLPELVGARFDSRKIPYIPDADDPPNADVIAQAPLAARHLVEPHGGRPALANLPRGMDLDEWLISLNSRVRARALGALLNGARKLPVHTSESAPQTARTPREPVAIPP